MHTSSTRHHGMMAGLFLALAIGTVGFLVQSELAKVFQVTAEGLIIAVLVVFTVLYITLRSRTD